MNIEKINPWLTLISNLSVVAGIIFLAVEINQNTSMIRIQTAGQEQERVVGRYIESPDLKAIEAKLGSVEGTNVFAAEVALVRDYGLTDEEAILWTRYLMDVWLANGINFRQNGQCGIGATIARRPYNRILFDEVANSSGRIGREYVECVKKSLE